MTPNERQQHAAAILADSGFSAAGAEWLTALHKAQSLAKQIQRTRSIPDKYGKHKFYIAPAEDFTEEGRRCLLPNGMGWLRQGTEICEINPHTQTLKLTAFILVYHAPSNQARVCWADWTARSDGDALAAAHTRLTRRFIQGLLQIAVVDELSPEEPPPPTGCPHPRDRHAVNADTSVACTLCGEFLGYAPPPQQPPQGFAPPPQGFAPPQQAQYAPPPQQGYTNPPMQEFAPPPQAPLPPISQEPIVQQAQQILEAEPVSQKQMRAELAPTPQATTVAGEPQNPDDWRTALMERGMDEGNATQIALLSDAAPVEPSLVEDMRNWAWTHYAGDREKMNTAWLELGFTPVPSLPLDQRPRPTGIQAKRFLNRMTFQAK